MNYFKKRAKAFQFAITGLKLFLRKETHAKVHSLAGSVVLLLALYLDVSNSEWLVLLLTIALVIAMEVLNSALEKLTDIAAPGFSEKAGQVKDMAAGAVLVAAVFSVIIGAVIFIPKLMQIF